MGTQVGRVLAVNAKQTKAGVVYEIGVEGFKKPLTTWKEDIAKQAQGAQGLLVNVDYDEKPETFTSKDGHIVNTVRYYLNGVTAVEPTNGETTLNEVMQPIAQQQSAQRLQESYGSDIPHSPSESVRQAEIRRAVALKAAIEYAAARMQAGEELNEANILEYTNNFQAILESR